ncbi:transposase [Fodinibius halophilus]|uniref:Transposase IS200-like domain-containing protein n=1 Tax=Fodinibius halophilus TaxID=1736908 RepID=A0A6M1TGC8_9BACT|nr:transposase [Fodinibius halophilus]NGP89152.1 hypothetical protein [Fodinibius halophilus]
MAFYRRNLPHWQPPNAEYFVTFRLTGSLPKKAIARIKSLRNKQSAQTDLDNDFISTRITRRIFKKYEHLLAGNTKGPFWLKKPEIAQLVCDAIEYRDNEKYLLYSYCVMPNHVHIVFKLLANEQKKDEYPVTKILGSLKKFTARKANQILNRTGQFWQHESFDRVIRNSSELENTIKYVLLNPVKAELTDEWQNWPYSYCNPDFRKSIAE